MKITQQHLKFASYALCVGIMLDLISTYIGITHMGLTELNPIASLRTLFIINIIVMAAVLALINRGHVLSDKFKPYAFWPLITVAAFRTGVALWNFGLIIWGLIIT